MTKCEQTSPIGIIGPRPKMTRPSGLSFMQAPMPETMMPSHFETVPFVPPPTAFSLMGLEGEGSRPCCHAQFTIRQPFVESYRAEGTCFTDCRHRPSSRPCDGEPPIDTTSNPVFAKIRQTPRAPAVGANQQHVALACGQQRGWLFDRDKTATCLVGGEAIFVCKHDGQQIIQCDTLFEGADFAAFLAAAENRLGPPTDERVSGAGVRVFGWPNAGYALTTYAKGVQVTVARVPR